MNLVVIGLAGWAFGSIVQDVLAGENAHVDRPVNRFFLHHRDNALTPWVKVLTFLGSEPVLIGLMILAGAVWWFRSRSWRPLLLCVGAWGGAAVLSNSIKALIGRPRPPSWEWIGTASGSSFPSGHATGTVAVYGMLAALLAASTPYWSRKVGLWAGAAIL